MAICGAQRTMISDRLVGLDVGDWMLAWRRVCRASDRKVYMFDKATETVVAGCSGRQLV